jgi:hypothetical protein
MTATGQQQQLESRSPRHQWQPQHSTAAPASSVGCKESATAYGSLAGWLAAGLAERLAGQGAAVAASQAQL